MTWILLIWLNATYHMGQNSVSERMSDESYKIMVDSCRFAPPILMFFL